MKFLYTFFLALLCIAAMAQSNYHAGYVLKNSGDTLKGYINYREWVQSPKTIDFKANKNDKNEIEFTPQTIKGFQIDGMETYISYSGIISTNKITFPDLPEGLDTGKEQSTIFLKQVTTGKYITLYYNGDELKTRLFIAEKNAIPVELNYYVYYGDDKKVINSHVYNGQLLLYINKFCPDNNKLISDAEKVKYEEVYLEPLIDEINNSNGKSNNIKKAISSRLFVGIAVNSTKTEVDNVNYVDAIIHSTSVSPKINFGIDVFNNPHIQQLIFRAELSLSYIAPRLKYPSTATAANSDYIYEFNQYTAAITPQIIFNVYNSDSFKFYLDAGFSFNFSAYSNNKLIIQYGDATTVNKPYILQSYWSNFPLQAGVVLNKKMEIYFNYTPYASYTKYTEFYASNQSMNLGFKFFLK